MYKSFFIALTFGLLSSCGGGFGEVGPSVSQIDPTSLKFGQTAVIYVAGKYLRNDMTAETGSCTSPSYSASSTPDLAILNCKVTAVGSLPIRILASNGDLLFSTTLTVKAPQVTMLTSMGTLILELDPKAAPLTVNNFLGYVNQGYYGNTLFHRVISGFVAQGGGYASGMVFKAGDGDPIVLESNRGLSNLRGTLAMARTADANSATTEFFVNLKDNLFLDYQSATSPGYAVFGKVMQGMEVVDAMADEPTHVVSGFQDVPVSDIVISAALQTQ